MRRLILTVVLSMTYISISAPADAAMCFEFKLDPPSPRAGETVAVDVKTMWFSNQSTFAFRVFAPDGSTSLVGLTQIGSDEHWHGKLVFDRPGTWALQAQIAVPSNTYPCFYQTVEVAPAAMTGPVPDVRTAVAVAVLAVAALAIVIMRKTRGRAMNSLGFG